MMSDNEDDFSNEYSLDVPTDEEEEDVRHFYEHASYDPDAAVGLQEQPRMTPPSVLLLPSMTPPATNTMMMLMTPTHTPPPRSPRTRRFTSLPLHLEESLARATTLNRARTTSAVTHSHSPVHDTFPQSPFSDIAMSDLHQQPPSPRPRRAAGCSRVLLVLVAYVGLMIFPRPPLLRFRSLSSQTSVIPIPKLENEFMLVAPSLIENTALQPKEENVLPEQQQQEQQQPLSSPQEQQQQSKRRVRQPTLAHARTNRRSTIFYGGKPDASLLFLDHMEEPPLQQRQLPRFFFSAARTANAATASHGRRSFFKKESAENSTNDDQQQQQQHWLWWILYKVAWLVLLGCTLEAGVREIPRRFHTWTGLWPAPTHSRIHSSTSASNRHGMALSSSSSPPPPLSRAFSTPRRRRG